MLVRITNKCLMGCKHCMVEASPDGEHMTKQVFADVVDFIRRGLPMILISGGEPTEHPELLDFVLYSRLYGLEVLLLSNGEWLHQWEPDKRDELLEAVWRVQVTNDPAFYPRHVEPFEHEKVMWETQLRQVSPHGRARTSGMRTSRRAPECFNLRSFVRAGEQLQSARMCLLGMGMMCTPSINVDGSIRAGESPECKNIGQVTDDEATIAQNLRMMRCHRCGLVNNLEQREKRAIGEATLFLAGERDG